MKEKHLVQSNTYQHTGPLVSDSLEDTGSWRSLLNWHILGLLYNCGFQLHIHLYLYRKNKCNISHKVYLKQILAYWNVLCIFYLPLSEGSKVQIYPKM